MKYQDIQYNAGQGAPYQLSKKVFKSKTDKETLAEYQKIVRSYYPNYADGDIVFFFKQLEQEGCTYATYANLLVEQLGVDHPFFASQFSLGLYDQNGKVNCNKVMVDLYACLKDMVQLDLSIYKYETSENVFSFAKKILGQEFTSASGASVALFEAGWPAEGFTENHECIYKSRNCINKTFYGTYSSIAKEIFGEEFPELTKEKLELLLKQKKFGYRFKNENAVSKLSGLVPDVNCFWMNLYLQMKHVPLQLEIKTISYTNISLEDAITDLVKRKENGASISVSTSNNTPVWMTDGHGWMKAGNETAGHKMNFYGVDESDNLLVISYGVIYRIPKDYIPYLQIQEVQVCGLEQERNRGI